MIKLVTSATPTLVCFSHLRWDFVYQRPQHLLTRAAKSFQVFFIEEPVFRPGIQPHMETRDRGGITIAVPFLPIGMDPVVVDLTQRSLIEKLIGKTKEGPRVLWYYTPIAMAFTAGLAADLVVYDNMDELSAFREAAPRTLALEDELFERADLVFTGGMSLYEAKRKRHPHVHAFPSSIDTAHFGTARDPSEAEPEDQAGIAGPKLGFFGVIDERLNLDLVGQAAELRPDWQFVMVGPVVKIDEAALPHGPNIHWLGGKGYAELPRYLAGWDVGIMPFAINEATRFISPTKTPEFLSAGVPVVSTPINDVVKPYGEKGLVEIARTAGELVDRAGTLMRAPKERWLSAVDRHLAGSSWDETWNSMAALMRGASRRAKPIRRQPSVPASLRGEIVLTG